MPFNPATALARLDTTRSAGLFSTIDKVTNKVQGLAPDPSAALGEQLGALGQSFAGMLDPINKVSTALAALGAGITDRIGPASRQLAPWLPATANLSAENTDAMKGKLGRWTMPPRIASSAAGGMGIRNAEIIKAMSTRPEEVKPHGAGGRTARTRGGGRGILAGLPGLKAGCLLPASAAGKAAMEQSSPLTSLAGLAEKMQQEAARQDADRQHLAAQQEANGHLGALAGAAGGAGLRVQVVGTQPGQW
jgi:hypothetical protein